MRGLFYVLRRSNESNKFLVFIVYHIDNFETNYLIKSIWKFLSFDVLYSFLYFYQQETKCLETKLPPKIVLLKYKLFSLT